MIKNRDILRTALFAALGAAFPLLLAGCGGTTTNSGPPAPNSGPVIYGASTLNGLESSGLGGTINVNGQNQFVGFITAAVSSTSQPLPGAGALATGFVPGSEFPDKSFGFAAPAGQPNVVFRALVSNGDLQGVVQAINPSSAVLTSAEVAGFSQPMTFDAAGIGGGPLGGGQYTTAPFTLPFTTTGLHSLTATIADVGSTRPGNPSTTTFETAVVAPTDAVVLAQILDSTGAPVAGAKASITGQITPVAPAVDQTTADGNGVVVLFATPGAPDANGNTNTITVASADGTQTGTLAVPLKPGQAYDTPDGAAALTITIVTPGQVAHRMPPHFNHGLRRR